HGGEGLHDGVDHALRGLVIAAYHGAIGVGAQHGARRHDHPQRAIASLVGRSVGRHERLHGVVHAGAGDVVRGVDGTESLAVGAREVEGRLVAALLDADPDADAPGLDAVVVEGVLALPGAVAT